MAGPRITEVSLTLYVAIAWAGAIHPLQKILSLIQIALGSWRTYPCGFGFWLAYRNVPDECVFCFQGAGEELGFCKTFSETSALSALSEDSW
jgi:hypothetical protein